MKANYHEPNQDDFDFPCSYSFRSFIEQEITGRALPSIDPPEPPRPEPQPAIVYTGLSSKERNEFNQLKSRMNYLDTKILALTRKKKKEYKYGYKEEDYDRTGIEREYT